MTTKDGIRDSLEPEDLAVLDEVARAVAETEAGFDDSVLGAVMTALEKRVRFDRITVSADDEDPNAFRIFFRTGIEHQPTTFTSGVRVQYDPKLEGFTLRDVDPTHAVIVERAGSRGTPLDAMIAANGVRSYVTLPMLTESGARTGWLSVSHDDEGAPSQHALPLLWALARKLAPAVERSRILARARLMATLVDDSPDGMLALDPSRSVREVNPSALRLLGRSRGDAFGRPLIELIGGPGADALNAALNMLEQSGPGLRETLTIAFLRGGEQTWLDVVMGRVEGSTEATFHVHLRDAGPRIAASEATARKMEHLSFLRALGETVASELRVDVTLERALDVCVARWPIAGIGILRDEIGCSTMRIVASRGIEEALLASLAHVTTSELEASTRESGTWSLVVPLAHARRSWGALLVLGRENGAVSEGERWLWESVAATLSASLRVADDFERVVALEAERRQLVDSLPVIVVRVDHVSGVTSFANRAVFAVLGVEQHSVLGSPGLAGFLADDREKNAAMVAHAAAARGERTGWQDRRYLHRDGRTLTLRENVYPVFDAGGAVVAVQVIAYDVTIELESRSRLVQADRLSSLGALAAGIAHEINNPVAFIALAAGQLPKILDRALGANEPNEDARRLGDLAGEIGEATARIAEIVGELKLFTRIPDGASSTPVDINRIVQMAITLTSGELRRSARLDVSLGDVPLAPGQFSIVGQAFVNLLMNAAQAVNAAPSARQHVVRVASSMRKGSIVVLVSDTGAGIQGELLPRIFDPFFPTESHGESENLGLAIAYDLVQRVGGDIRVTSKPGEGATFEVELPLEPAMAADARSSPRLYSLETPGEGTDISISARARVLIIDDELALVKALARQLAGRYDVDTASSASDALAQLAARAYDAVVCDLRMPDQSGPAIHDLVRARSGDQAARFIFTTGGSYGMTDDEIHERARVTGRPILEKPFDGAGFEAAVASVVEE